MYNRNEVINEDKIGVVKIKNGMKSSFNRLKPEISKKSIKFDKTPPLPKAIKDNNSKLKIDKYGASELITQESEGLKIKILYNTDINLIEIHENIRERFSELLAYLPFNKLKIIKLKQNLNKNIYTKSESTRQNEIISKLENEINILENGYLWNNYITEVENILESYIPLMSDESKKKIVYGSKKKLFEEVNFTEEEIKKRLKLIDSYLSIVTRLLPEKYLKIECNWSGKIDICCPCGESYSNMSPDDDRGVQVCGVCGIEKPTYFNNTNWENSTNINPYTKSDYEGLKTFKIAWLEHQGRCADYIPESVFKAADKYFQDYQIGDRYYYENIKCDKSGRKQGTSIDIIIAFMKNKNYTMYYNLYNIFGRDYFGWILPDYSDLDDAIYEAYQITQTIYEEMEKERKFNINNELRQCFLLLSFGVNVSFAEDFKTMSRDVIIDVQSHWYNMCEKTGFKVKYVPIIG